MPWRTNAYWSLRMNRFSSGVGSGLTGVPVRATAKSTASDRFECSYPNEYSGMAKRFGHQTPQDLAKWRASLGDGTKVLVTHLKPSREEQTRRECASLADPGLVLMAAGDAFDL